MEKQVSLEESFEQLDGIIEALESGKLSLEDSFKQYNDGIKLVQNCVEQLDQVEKKIIILNGEMGNEDEV